MAGPSGKPPEGPPRERLDVWLFQARFFKTRMASIDYLNAGHLRVNGFPVTKASALVAEGDVLTFPLGKRIRVIRVLSLAERRGPASEARELYLDLDVATRDPASSPLE